MSRGLADLARSLHALPDAIERGKRAGTGKAALHVTRAVRGQIRAVTGDMRLSGVGRRGARVGARYNVKGTANPTALVSAVGPLHLIERGTRPHEIKPKRRGSKVLKFADGRYARSADHPGTRGQRPFGKGVDRTKHEVVEVYNREVFRQMARAFGQ